MKKLILLISMISLVSLLSCEGTPDNSSIKTGKVAAINQENAFTQIPVPTVKYFVERQTTAKWVDTWDKPQVITYLYLLSSTGNFIGYYVCNGKPASTKSYLVPEESYQRLPYPDSNRPSPYVLTQSPDLDGTYGDNNPGLRFFTAEGIAVEVGNLPYIFSNGKLPLNVPKLNPIKE